MLFRRRWVILGVFLLVLAAAGYMAYRAMQQQIYQTQSLVLVDVTRIPRAIPTNPQDQSDFFARAGATLNDEILLLGVSQPLTRQAGEIIKARLQVQEGAAEYPTLLQGQPVQDLSPEQLGQRGRAILAGFVPRQGTTNVLQIMAQGPSAAEVALVSNAYAQAYEQITQKVSLAKVSRTAEAMEELVSQRRAELEEIEGRIRAYVQRNPTATLDASGMSLNQQILTLQAQRDESERNLAEERASLANLEEQREQVRRIMGDRTVARLRDELEAAKTRLSAVEGDRELLLNTYPRLRQNPSDGRQEEVARLRELTRLRDEAQGRVDQLSDRYAQALAATGGITDPEQAVSQLEQLNQRIWDTQGRVRSLEASLNRANSDLQRYQTQLNSLPGQQSELAALQREKAQKEQAYLEAVNALRGNDLQQSSEGGYVQVIQPAAIPVAPMDTGALNTLLLGAFLGLLFGVGLAFVLELSSNRLYKQEDVEKLGVNVLDFVPFTDALSKKNRKKRITVGAHDVSAALVALFSPFGPYVEALRKLEASIGFAAPEGRTFMVTSSRPGEGKSVTIANLAILFARSGRRTLLVDADMRRPQVHDLFGLSNEVGLANVLSPSDAASLDAAIADLGIENLHVLPSGQSSRISTELLRAGRFEGLLEALREDYDIVLIDTPPVLAISDAEVMAPHVDGLIMMCRAGMTRSGELVSALESLKRARVNLIGTVLNGFKITMAYGYRYRYGKYAGKGYYGYGYDYASAGDKS